jgi:IS1 family transposase
MVINQDEIAPGPLPASEPPDVLHLQRTIESLERENAWLKEQLARVVRDSK